MYQLGALVGKLILMLVFILGSYALGIKEKKRRPLSLLFIFGWILYVLSMELRPFFKGNHAVLFWFGIIPSFGCAFALPLIGLRDKTLTYVSAKQKLLNYSSYTFLLLSSYEFLELIKGLGTFDWLDLIMTIFGLVALNLIFRTLNFERVFSDQMLS